MYSSAKLFCSRVSSIPQSLQHIRQELDNLNGTASLQHFMIYHLLSEFRPGWNNDGIACNHSVLLLAVELVRIHFCSSASIQDCYLKPTDHPAVICYIRHPPLKRKEARRSEPLRIFLDDSIL
jgi:hypothetical protein